MPRSARLRPVVALPLLLALVSVLPASGCGGKQRRAEEAAAQHVYAQPLEQVWAQARTLLREQGYGVREDTGTFEMLTDVRAGNELSTVGVTHWRIYVKGGRTPDGRALVEFFRVEWLGATVDDPNRTPLRRPKRTRDHGLEWQLLQRVDPEAARKLSGS